MFFCLISLHYVNGINKVMMMTDTMTVSLNLGSVRKRRSDACTRSGGRHFEHML